MKRSKFSGFTSGSFDNGMIAAGAGGIMRGAKF